MESLVSYVNTLFTNPRLQDRGLIVFLGPNGAGKTTLLYRFQHRKFLESFPTLRHNADTARVPTVDTELAIWDIPERWSTAMKRYGFLQSWDTVFVFVVDVTHDVRSNPAIDDLKSTLKHLKARYLAIVFNKFDAKSSSHPEVQELITAVKETLEQYKTTLAFPCEVYDHLDRFSAKTGEHTDIFMESVAHMATTRKVPVEQPSREDLLKKIKATSENPDSRLAPDEFMRRIANGALHTWDHRSYLRAAFLTLTECASRETGVFEATELLMERLGAMQKADRERLKDVPDMSHRTLTMFWLHQIYLIMLSFRKTNGTFPEPEGFDEILTEYPDLMDEKLWASYYSKKNMFSRTSLNRWIWPDRKRLPQFISRPEQVRVIEEKPKLPSRNARILKRFAYAIIKTTKSRNERRAAVINRALPVIQSRIMCLRARSPQICEPYSETQAYFWIQMLHAAVESLPFSFAIDLTQLDFDSFMAMFPDRLANDDVWEEYYSAEKWNSIEARIKTVLPDLKAFPNVLQSPDQARVKEVMALTLDEKRFAKDKKSVSSSSPPTTEELLLEAHWAVKPTAGSTKHDTNPPNAHAELIRRIFDRLVEVEEQTEEKRAMALSSAAWDAVSFLCEEDKMTCAVFWSQMVLQAFVTMDTSFHEQITQSRAKEGGLDCGERTQVFLKFLSNSPQICWESLWTLYYSDDIWKSEDAKRTHVLPDKRAIPAYLNGEDAGLSEWEWIGE